ncbi:hypothetical protein MalM25_33390 [Planctomycetes bacterium MalM25]|nr:hypothetical protein MalM25_33390 [Planctomycetes bacterium MalM25]
MRSLSLLIALLLAAPACGHGVPALVTTDGGALALLGASPVGELTDDGFEIYAEEPGFGVNLAASGPPPGTRIGLETVGGLMRWDGAELVETDSILAIESPLFDSLGNSIASDVELYEVAHDTASLTGMTWATYPGGSFWDAHGYYTLAASEGAPATGLYGAPVRLVDLSATLAPSEPFVLPMRFDPSGAWSGSDVQQGLDALNAALTEPLPGDFNDDGAVNGSDYQVWRATYGPADAGARADANGDGRVDAADYTVWRDAAGAASARALPEPAAGPLAAGCFFFLMTITFRINGE